jgi:hypothetical protein
MDRAKETALFAVYVVVYSGPLIVRLAAIVAWDTIRRRR